MLSGSLEEKELGYEPRSRVYAGEDWGWQTEESYQKIQEDRNRGVGSEAVDFIEEKAGQALGLVNQIPGATQALQFVGGAAKFVDETFMQPSIQAAEDPSQAGTPQALVGTVLKGGEMAQEGGAQVARNLGVDPRIGSFVAGAAYETVTGAAVGKIGKALDTLTPPSGGGALQLAGANGSIRMTNDVLQPPTVMKATTSPKWTARGAGQDVSTKSQFKGQVTAYDERLRLYDEAVEIERAKFDRGEINEYRLKATLTKIQKMRTSDEVTFEYVRNLPSGHPLVELHRYAFKQNITGSFNPSISIPGFSGPRSQVQQVLKRGAASKWAKTWDRVDPWEPKKLAQQHHILAKAETTPFAETLNRLRKAGAADDDDLVNFFLWSEQYDLFPGNVAENLLDMGEITHTVARKDPMALHNILKEAQLEFGGVTKKEIAKRYGLDKVKTTDELMEAYDRYLREIAVPSKDITYKVYDYWVEKTRRSLKGQALIDFNERVKALNVPRELEGWSRNNKRNP